MTTIIALVLATAIPLIVLYILNALDLYKTGSFRYILISFVAGGLALGAGYFINSNLFAHFGNRSYYNMTRYVAPVVEEILKALILYYLVRRPSFTYFVDGAIYGFAAGIGFAVFENYEYILNSGEGEIMVAVGRILSTNLVHGSASAVVGLALGLSRVQKFGGRALLMGGGLLGAIIIHSAFNNLVTRVGGGMILLYAALFGFAGVGFIVYSMKRGLAIEKVWIEEKLGMTDRVTAQEARVVHRLGDLGEILEPLEKRFGEEKAVQIENFLTVQARLGIKRKTLDLLTDEKMRRAVEAEMAGLRAQMDKSRREVGSYVMLYLRNIFPADASPLWGRLENLIQERAAARPKEGGMNLWANLGQRTAGSQAAQTASPDKASPAEAGAQDTSPSETPAETPAAPRPKSVFDLAARAGAKPPSKENKPPGN